MKKKSTMLVLFVALIGLSVCAKGLLNSQPKQKSTFENPITKVGNISESQTELQLSEEASLIRETDKALELYRELLKGERAMNYDDRLLNISKIISSEKDTDRDYNTHYTLFDTNGDGLPELHIRSQSHYYILTYKDRNLVVWAKLTPYYKQLNNRAFLHTRPGGTPSHVGYIYIVLNFKGEEMLRISFEKWDDNQNDVYDEADLYIFDEVELSKEDWHTLTEKYLSIGSDQIEWFAFSDGELAF